MRRDREDNDDEIAKNPSIQSQLNAYFYVLNEEKERDEKKKEQELAAHHYRNLATQSPNESAFGRARQGEPYVEELRGPNPHMQSPTQHPTPGILQSRSRSMIQAGLPQQQQVSTRNFGEESITSLNVDHHQSNFHSPSGYKSFSQPQIQHVSENYEGYNIYYPPHQHQGYHFGVEGHPAEPYPPLPAFAPFNPPTPPVYQPPPPPPPPLPLQFLEPPQTFPSGSRSQHDFGTTRRRGKTPHLKRSSWSADTTGIIFGASSANNDPPRGKDDHGHSPKKARRSQPSFSKSTFIWSEETKLPLISLALEYRGLYRKNLWWYIPLPPAVLDETNVHHFMCTDKGMAEQSSLALSFYVVMALGSSFVPQNRDTQDYYARAQLQFDAGGTCTDYSLALAGTALASHALYVLADSATSMKYLSRAMDICRELGQLNSDAYVRCLYMLVLHPSGRNLEALNKVSTALSELSQKKYYAITSLSNQEISPFRSIASLQSQMPVSLQNLELLNSAVAMVCNAILVLARDSISPEDKGVIANVLDSLESFAMRMTRNEPASKDPLPPPAKKWFRLCYYGLGAHCQHRLGQELAAFNLASCFLSKLQMQKFERAMGVAEGLNFVFHVFLHLGKMDAVDRLIEAVEPWCKAFGFINKLKADFVAKLAVVGRSSRHGADEEIEVERGQVLDHSEQKTAHRQEEPRRSWGAPGGQYQGRCGQGEEEEEGAGTSGEDT